MALNAILSVSPVAALSAILVGEWRRDLSVGGFEDLIELCLCFLQYENPKRRLLGLKRSRMKCSTVPVMLIHDFVALDDGGAQNFQVTATNIYLCGLFRG